MNFFRKALAALCVVAFPVVAAAQQRAVMENTRTTNDAVYVSTPTKRLLVGTSSYTETPANPNTQLFVDKDAAVKGNLRVYGVISSTGLDARFNQVAVDTSSLRTDLSAETAARIAGDQALSMSTATLGDFKQRRLGRVFTVSTSSGDYSTVSDAVAAAGAGGASSAAITILIDGGSYTEPGPIVLPNNVNLMGLGRLTTLNFATASPAVTVVGNSGIERLAIVNSVGPGIDILSTSTNTVRLDYANGQGATGYGIRISSTNAILQRVGAIATSGHGLWLNGSAGLSVFDATLQTSGGGNAMLQSGSGGGGGAFYNTTFNGGPGFAAVQLNGGSNYPRLQSVAICGKSGQFAIDATNPWVSGGIGSGVITYTNSCVGGGGLSKLLGANVVFFPNQGSGPLQIVNNYSAGAATDFTLWATTSTNNRGLVVWGPGSACPGCVGVGTPSAGGVGTPASGVNFQVNGTGQVGSSNLSGGASTPLRTQNPNSPAVSGASARITARVGNSGGSILDMGGIAGLIEDVSTSDGALLLLSGTAGTLSEKARIGSNGRLLMAPGNGIDLSGPNGTVVSESSITAGKFYGDLEANEATANILATSSGIVNGPLRVKDVNASDPYALWASTSDVNRGLVVWGGNSACPGCVGIGTPSAGGIGTPSSGVNLQVNGTGQVGSSNSSGGASTPLRTQNPNNPAVSGASARITARVGTTGMGIVDMGGIAGLVEDVSTGNGALLLLSGSAGVLSEKARIGSNGRLTMSNGNGIDLSGSGGTIVTESSVTAGKFYGDGTGLDGVTFIAREGQPNGVATLDGGGKIPVGQLPNSVMEYQGSWDPTTNTPYLSDGDPFANNGDVYRASVEGSTAPLAGGTTFFIGDFIIYNGSVWERSPMADGVQMVNGYTGAVNLVTDDIPEDGSPVNLYFTNARAQAAVQSQFDAVAVSTTAEAAARSAADVAIGASTAALDASKLNRSSDTMTGQLSVVDSVAGPSGAGYDEDNLPPAGNLIANSTGVVARVSGVEGWNYINAAAFFGVGYNDSGGGFTGICHGGTESAPTFCPAGALVSFYGSKPYDGTTPFSQMSSKAAIQMTTAEDSAVGANGMNLSLDTTLIGTSTRRQRVKVYHDGRVAIAPRANTITPLGLLHLSGTDSGIGITGNGVSLYATEAIVAVGSVTTPSVVAGSGTFSGPVQLNSGAALAEGSTFFLDGTNWIKSDLSNSGYSPIVKANDFGFAADTILYGNVGEDGSGSGFPNVQFGVNDYAFRVASGKKFSWHEGGSPVMSLEASTLTVVGAVQASTFNAVGTAYQVNNVTVIDGSRNASFNNLTVTGTTLGIGGGHTIASGTVSGASVGVISGQLPQRTTFYFDAAGFQLYDDQASSATIVKSRHFQYLATTTTFVSQGAASQNTINNPSVCLATATITTGNNPVLITNHGGHQAGSSTMYMNFLIDGQSLPGWPAGSSTVRTCQTWDNGSNDANMACTVMSPVLSAGTHNICVAMGSSGGGAVRQQETSVIEIGTGGSGVALPVSSTTFIPVGQSVATTDFGKCLSGSTVTVSMNGEPLSVELDGSGAGSSNEFWLGLLVNGKFASGQSDTTPLVSETTHGSGNPINMSFVWTSTETFTGPTSVCLTAKAHNTGSATFAVNNPARLRAYGTRNAAGTGDVSSNGNNTLSGINNFTGSVKGIPVYIAVFESASTTNTTYTINLANGTTTGGTLTFLKGSSFPANAKVIYQYSLTAMSIPGSAAGANNSSVTVGTAQLFTASSNASVTVSNNPGAGYPATGSVIFFGYEP